MNEARRPVETPIVETPVEARAGFLDRPVLVVLCVSLALCIVVLGALWFGFLLTGILFLLTLALT